MLIRILMLLALGATPALSETLIKDDQWKTAHSMGCMMLRECKKDTETLTYWTQLGDQFEEYNEELSRIFGSMGKLGIGAYIADDKYFMPRTRGIYDVKRNNFFINKAYLEDPRQTMGVLRHELWHAVQDCMAGTLDNTFTAVVWQDGKVPDWVRSGAENTYYMSPMAIPYEAEAMWAAHSNVETADGLAACAHPRYKMWEQYDPTPMTKEWLMDKGYIK
jgi:hypothetical protein